MRQAGLLDALLHNTISPTVVHGGYKTNVIPSLIELELDGRVLPGYSADDIMQELRTLTGLDLELEIIRHDPGRADVDMSLFPFLAGLISEADPEGKPIPSVVGGFTDGRMFARLGIQNYGFLPMKIPSDFNSGPTVHAANERVPLDAFLFGVEVIDQLVRRYHMP
jgi:acetylornithine deacetylase/succinyl-diaminopimelate desuccinylase-like protein